MPILIPSGQPASVAWIDWAERLQLHLRECPTVVIADELRRSAVDFYRDTRAWRTTGVALCTTVAGQASYSVAVPELTALAGLVTAWLGRVEIDEATPDELDEKTRTSTSGDSVLIGITGPTTVRLAPAPIASGVAVVATVAYRPADDAPSILDSLHQDHRGTIEAMTLERMLAQPGKPWTDYALAGKHSGAAASSALFDSTQAGPVRRRLRTKWARL